jgi:hypothetical protein
MPSRQAAPFYAVFARLLLFWRMCGQNSRLIAQNSAGAAKAIIYKFIFKIFTFFCVIIIEFQGAFC